MSKRGGRKSPDRHRAFGAVRLECPVGHRIGLAFKQPNGRYGLGPGLALIDSPTGTSKIKARCLKCEEEMIYRDLQVSWENTVMPLLDRLEKDPTAGEFPFKIG